MIDLNYWRLPPSYLEIGVAAKIISNLGEGYGENIIAVTLYLALVQVNP